MQHKTRESWLKAGVEKLRPIFIAALNDLEYTCELPSEDSLQLAVVPLKKKAIGTCWDIKQSKNEAAHPLALCASLEDPAQVLATLVHELIHATVGCGEKHNKVFGKLARKIGLEGKLTATVAGEDLAAQLEDIAKQLGPYPHIPFNKRLIDKSPDPKEVKNVTFKSTTEGLEKYKVATKRHLWEEYGAPRDPAGNEMVPLRATQ